MPSKPNNRAARRSAKRDIKKATPVVQSEPAMRKRDMSVPERRAIAQAEIARQGVPIDGPIRFTFARRTDESRVIDGIKQFRNMPLWYVPRSEESASKKGCSRKPYQVRDLKSGMWTCNCRGWRDNRGKDCIHIKNVKRQFGFSEPFLDTPRRPGTVWVFPPGSLREGTRRNNARFKTPLRVPELYTDLLVDVAQEPVCFNPDGTVKRGPKGLPLRAAALALLQKVFSRGTWASVAAHFAKSDLLWELGWGPDHAPDIKTYIRRTGHHELPRFLWDLFIRTARTVRNIDVMGLVDSYDIPTVLVDNSRDRKIFKKRPKYRKTKEQVREHVFMGEISKVCIAANITLDHGVGSGDGNQLPYLMRMALDNETIEELLKAAGDQAYGTIRNFAQAELMHTDLYVRSKINENHRQGKDWPASARRLGALEHESQAAFDEEMRKRPDVEGFPSRVKRRCGHMTLRWRPSTDVKKQLPVNIPDTDKADVNISKLPEDQIQAILETAQANVGSARLSEAICILIIINLCAIVTLEELTDERVDFKTDFAFSPIRQVREEPPT